jgi:putative hemolysin
MTFPAATRLRNAAHESAPPLSDAPQRPARDPDGGGSTLGRLGSLSVRLATSWREIEAAQRLRYRVFHKEMAAARSDFAAAVLRRDADEFDAICDHLLVFDHGASSPWWSGPANIVGTYRLLRQEVADRHFGFYSAREFDVVALQAAHPSLRFLELGRSCVLKPYRNRRTIELLWHGIWTYVIEHGVDAMVGCASFAGTDPTRLALPLSFLHYQAAPPRGWLVSAMPGRGVAMNRLSADAIDMRAAMRALPPLIKGYLRLGACFADNAVVDRRFGTTDVLAVLPVAAINRRYVKHFGAGAERFSALNQRPSVRGHLTFDC